MDFLNWLLDMMDTPRTSLVIVGIVAILAISSGCVPLDESLDSTVTGTVNTKTFDAEAGSAEQTAGGVYVITLADTEAFACQSTQPLPESYLTVVIADVDEAPQTLQASDVVTFNDTVDGVGVPSAATSGTVTIDAIDDFGGRIEGTIDATGPNSSVSGDFTVEICL